MSLRGLTAISLPDLEALRQAIEAGVLVEDVELAKQLVRQWEGLLASGLACRYGG
ncbi:MAG TPA: hypothetical protein VGG06_29290 [Thermoanaerobaculia bacterium]|jgi:hypothetical protein